MPKPKFHVIVTVTKFIVFHWVCRSCGQANESKVWTTDPCELHDCGHCGDHLALDITIKQFAYHYRQI